MIVLDSSAVLAVMQDEPGSELVLERLPGATISAVNLSEVTARILDRGGDLGVANRSVARLRMNIVAFDTAQAQRTGELRPLTREFGLSLGDRACLALAEMLGATVLTSDRSLARVDLGIPIQLIR